MKRARVEEKVKKYCNDNYLPYPKVELRTFLSEVGYMVGEGEFGFIPFKESDPALEIESERFDMIGDSGKYGENKEYFAGTRDYYVRENGNAISFYSEKRIGFFVYTIPNVNKPRGK